MSGLTREVLTLGAVVVPGVALAELVGASAGFVWAMFWLMSYLLWGLMGHKPWSMRP
jgi:hypothetical protein